MNYQNKTQQDKIAALTQQLASYKKSSEIELTGPASEELRMAQERQTIAEEKVLAPSLHCATCNAVSHMCGRRKHWRLSSGRLRKRCGNVTVQRTGGLACRLQHKTIPS